MFKHYSIQHISRWQSFLVGFALNRKFTSLSSAMNSVLQEQQRSLNNQWYYCYTAPLIADLFAIYNSNDTSGRVLVRCIDCLQSAQTRNPIARQLLTEFIAIADSANIQYGEQEYH